MFGLSQLSFGAETVRQWHFAKRKNFSKLITAAGAAAGYLVVHAVES